MSHSSPWGVKRKTWKPNVLLRKALIHEGLNLPFMEAGFIPENTTVHKVL